MSETIRNLGRNVRVGLYLDDVKIGRDWKNITKWNYSEETYSGEDEYIGRDDIEPWDVPKMWSFSFTFEEDNAGQIDAVINGIQTAQQAGQKPKLRIVEFTENNDGTTSKVILSKISMKFGRTVGSKGDKVTREVTGRAGSFKLGS